MKDWLVPVLRQLISGLVALFAAWTVSEFGFEVTVEHQEFLTGALTTLGAALIGIVWVAVAKWLKPHFLRSWHPGNSQDPRHYH